jgi:hypothetical protein
MFADFDTFKQVLVNMFRNLGKERRTVLQLIVLKQTRPVTGYIAKFQ